MKSGSLKLPEPSGPVQELYRDCFTFTMRDTTSDRLPARPSVAHNTRLNRMSDFHEIFLRTLFIDCCLTNRSLIKKKRLSKGRILLKTTNACLP